ncbi:TPA: fimbrial protein [Enterobacter hormaechei]|uniref:fimbrial protein n=1 Tax=Enterobacter hormaechei TaxID=158836 RepID=UPI00288B5277|nr:fimbrial protein [Enterobacter hormaechei]EKS6649598.1 fimbrial protein [Enterobacter hormaechei]WNJ34242.1 fimbrial protein [Enterobacter hormaechei subsp. hormaechei]HDR1956304.1 fimbrial protein [Enterobacter hormaechei]
MKCYVFTLPLLGLMLAASPGRAETQIGTWTMNISGTVLPSTCDIDTTSQNPDVYIGEFASNAFANVGATSATAPLDIKLTGCSENIIGAKVTFTGTADSDNNQLLALSDTGGAGGMASGVGIEILTKDNVTIPINTQSNQLPLNAGDNTLNFLLRYKATKIPVTAGNASSIMYFDVDYQ